MLNSSPFNTTFPIFNEDDNISFSHLTDYEINPFTYYDRLQSPLNIHYDIEDFLSNHDLTMIHEPFQATNSPVITDDSSFLEVNTTKMDSTKCDNEANGVVTRTRRRTSNKDRHSKIRTAQGLRDRRMRLSLEVARPFFKLQDMLGFDKGSRTVEWLLKQSKTAIDELILSKNGSTSGVTKCAMSSISDCEGESIIVEQNKGDDNNSNSNKKVKKRKVNVVKDVKNKEKRLRTTKEAMKNAREKARKRTLEKLQSKGIIKDGEIGNSLGVSSDFVDDSLIGNWNLTFSYQQSGEVC